jgi:hypothetical protein
MENRNVIFRSLLQNYTIYISCLQQEYLNICLFQYLNLNSYDWMNFDLKEVHRYCTRYTVGTFFMSVKYVIIQAHNVKKLDRKITFLFSIVSILLQPPFLTGLLHWNWRYFNYENGMKWRTNDQTLLQTLESSWNHSYLKGKADGEQKCNFYKWRHNITDILEKFFTRLILNI